jgi:hypothetical protein
LVVRPISELLSLFSEPRGEFTLLVPALPAGNSVTSPLPDVAALQVEIGDMTKNGAVSGRAALKSLAAKYGVSVNALYRLINTDPSKGS